MNSKYFSKFDYGKRLTDEIAVTGLAKLPYHVPTVPYATEAEAYDADIVRSRYYYSLNGDWKFFYSDSFDGIPDDFESLSGDGWDTIPVPSCIQLHGYGDLGYLNVGYFFATDGSGLNPPFTNEKMNSAYVYKRTFTLPKNFSGKRVILALGGASSSPAVFINGKFAGYSTNSRSTAEFDITDFVSYEGENDISILLTRYSAASWLEDQDMFRMSGIYRDVFLYCTDTCHLFDIFTYTDFGESLADATLTAEVKLMNMGSEILPHHTVTMDVLAPDGTPVTNEENKPAVSRISSRFEEITPYKNFEAIKPGTVSTVYFTLKVDSPLLWSAETPELYTLVFKVISPEGDIKEIHSVKHGFRKIEVRDAELFVNGASIKLKGVNRHETHPERGYVVTREEMLADVIMMKRNNINAVRASHYPDEPYFYDLCDRYGLYVMDEANAETHGISYRKNILPGNDHRWLPMYMDRISSMVQCNKNHPSVIRWSLGNEIGFGETVAIAASYCKAYDPTRLVHKRQMNSIADMDSETYPSPEVMIEHATSKPHRMFVTNEYGHAMGNACGSLGEYWDAIYSHKQLIGGFVWEWCDHAIVKTDENGRKYYGYGGDFGEGRHDGNFCCDGLITPDRRMTSKLAELKKVHEFITSVGFDKKSGVLTVHNRYFHTDLSGFYIEYTVLREGKSIFSDKTSLPAIMPGCDGDVKLTFPEDFDFLAGDVLDISFRYKTDTPFAPRGHEVAFAQMTPTPGMAERPERRCEAEGLTVSEGDGDITVKSDKLTLTVTSCGEISAELDGIKVDNVNLPTFYRAYTDNDIRKLYFDGNGGPDNPTWKSTRFDKFETVTDSVTYKILDNGAVKITLSQKSSAGGDAGFYVNTVMTVLRDRIVFDNTVTPFGALPHLPRIGATLTLPADMRSCEWYGFGPYDTYPDRCRSGRLGIFSADAAEPISYYVKPQECGAKMNTVYMCQRNSDGDGIAVFGQVPYTMSALPFTSGELAAMRHTPNTDDIDHIILTVDYAQNGLGNRSCGPDVLPKYRLLPETVRFVYTLTRVYPNEEIKPCRYSEELVPRLEVFSASAIADEEDEEYRDPSDEDIRAKAGFNTHK